MCYNTYFFSQLGSLGVACSQEKHSSVHCNCVDVGHATSRLTAAPNTWGHANGVISDCLGCSFSLRLSSLAASEGVSLGQGGSPFGCRAGVGAAAGAGEAEEAPLAQSVLQVDHKDLQPGRRYSCSGICSGICLILCGTKSPEDSESHMGVVSVLRPQGPWLCWGQGFCLSQ